MDAPFMTELPEGLTARPMTMDDVHVVTQLVMTCEAFDSGRAEIDRDDIVADWSRPSFDLAAGSMGVFDGHVLVAQADVFRGRAEASVHPDHRGRGIGAWLLRWTEDCARDSGSPTVGQTVTDANHAAIDLFERQGYRYGHTSWVLRIQLDARPEAPGLPDGIAFRDFAPGADDREVYQVVEDAFNEWPDRQPTSFEDWYPMVLGRGRFEPWMMLLAVDTCTREIVGVAHLIDYDLDSGWVQLLATKASHRHRGIARALLQQAMAIFWDRGKPALELSTDSRTGALGLYEKVGMRVRASYTNRRKDLARAREGDR